MRITLTILILLTLISCSTNNDCKSRFEFISCNDSIPILNLDITKHADIIREEMNELYGFDLCEKCSLVDFKLPFTIEGQKGHLKIMADFDYPICENCPIPMRLRHYFSIMINQKNQLLVQGELIKSDSLQSKIENYLDKVGIEKMAPETFKQVNFRIFWNQETDIDFLYSVLKTVYNSHLASVELELEKDGKEFCKMDKKDVAKLKEQYPLRIEFDLGEIERMKPSNIEKRKEFELIESAEEIEIEIEI